MGSSFSDTSTKQIVMANRAMCRMLGYTTAEIASLRIDDIHPAEALAKRVLSFLTKKREEPFSQGFDIPEKRKTVPLFFAVLEILRHLIGEGIELTFKPGDNTGNIKIDPAQIDQILANLIVNARDAIADIGKITIYTEQVVKV